ncbi:hypothetical protein V8B97DRAFT_1052711 [Scleroderma yunnanense]
MARPLVSTRARKVPLPSPLPPRRQSTWQPRDLATPEPYSDELERIIDRCTSPTPYSHSSIRPSDQLLLRITDAVSGNSRPRSSSSTTLSCASCTKQPSIHTRGHPFMRVLHRLVSCISSRHHDDPDAIASSKKIGSDKSPYYASSVPDDEMDEKCFSEYEQIHSVGARPERSPPISLTRLETIEEREEEYL